jgi:hypothetical protein
MTPYAMLKYYPFHKHGSLDKTGRGGGGGTKEITFGVLCTKWLHILRRKVLILFWKDQALGKFNDINYFISGFMERTLPPPPPLCHSKVLMKFCTHTSTLKFLTKTGNNPKILLEETHISQ